VRVQYLAKGNVGAQGLTGLTGDESLGRMYANLRPDRARSKAGLGSLAHQHVLVIATASERPLSRSAILRANIRLGIPFRRRAELFITLRPVCSLSPSFVAL